MKMRKGMSLSWLVVVALGGSLLMTACGGDDKDDKKDEPQKTTQAPAPAPAPNQPAN